MTTQDRSVDDPDALDYLAEPDEQWAEEPDQLPRRPKRKLLAPVPVTLLALLLTAAGFLAGVEVEKGQASSSSSTGGLPAGLAALRGAGRTGTVSGTGRRGGLGGAAGSGFAGSGALPRGLTSGEVSYVSGSTLYVTNAQGNTIKVTAPAGATVTKSVSGSVKSIHPGDSVTVTGNQGSNGAVIASTISVNPGGSSTGGAGSGGSGSAAGTQQLFGAG